MFAIEPHSFKIIHWDYNKDAFGEASKDPDLYFDINPIYKPGTKEKMGVAFRWTTRLHSVRGLLLSCIGEDVYIIPDPTVLTVHDCFELIQSAFEKYHNEFKLLAAKEGLYPEIQYQVREDTAEQLLRLLNSQR